MDRVTSGCGCDCCDDGTLSPEAVAMIFDDDYQAELIPRSAMMAIREHYTRWLTEPSVFRTMTDVSDSSPHA